MWYSPCVKEKLVVLHLVRTIYFYLSYFITRIRWRLLNYSKAVQTSVLMPGVYWRGVAEMAERDWLSDCVWVRGGRGKDCGMECLPGRTAHRNLSSSLLRWRSENSSIREMHELVRQDSCLKLSNGSAFFHLFLFFSHSYPIVLRYAALRSHQLPFLTCSIFKQC